MESRENTPHVDILDIPVRTGFIALKTGYHPKNLEIASRRGLLLSILSPFAAALRKAGTITLREIEAGKLPSLQPPKYPAEAYMQEYRKAQKIIEGIPYQVFDLAAEIHARSKQVLDDEPDVEADTDVLYGDHISQKIWNQNQAFVRRCAVLLSGSQPVPPQDPLEALEDLPDL